MDVKCSATKFLPVHDSVENASGLSLLFRRRRSVFHWLEIPLAKTAPISSKSRQSYLFSSASYLTPPRV